MNPMEREMSSQLYPFRNRGGASRVFIRYWLRTRSSAVAVLLLVAAVFTTEMGHSEPALASLTAQERAALESGGDVSRRIELRQNGGKYIAAISYGVVPRSCDQVFSVLSNPGKHYTKALPATAAVRFDNRGDESRLWMKHGNLLINGSYTTHFKISAADGIVRFWLDKQKPRDVKDLFGYFKVSSWGEQHCLVTAAVAVDPGEGMVASMFRGMIGDFLSKSAGRIQRYTRRTTEPKRNSDSLELVTAAATQ